MTVILTSTFESFSYNGIGDYPFDFRVMEKPDLLVIHRTNATPPDVPVKTILTLDIDYHVTILDHDRPVPQVPGGGTVEIINTLLESTDHSLDFQRVTPITQETDWVNGEPFPMTTLEHDLDKMTCIAQELINNIQALTDFGEDSITGPVFTWFFAAEHTGPMPQPDDYGQSIANITPFFHKLRVFLNGSRLLEEIDSTVILGDFIVDWDNNNFTVKNPIPAGSTVMMEQARIDSFYGGGYIVS